MSNYLATLTEQFGTGWNRFWFRRTDPTTLGVLRVLSGLMALYMVGTYSFDLVRWFAPGGMLPNEVVVQLSGRYRWSILYLATNVTQLWTVHAISLAVLVLFTAGVFTRVTSPLAWIVVMSYIHRAPVLAGLMEPILAMVLFYVCLGGLFYDKGCAPLSFDGWWKRGRQPAATRPGEPGAVRSVTANVVVRLVQVHLCVVYLMMGIAKLAEPATVDATGWWGGEAVWWLIARPESRLIDLTGLYDNLYVLNAWTHAIVLFELAFGILIWNRLARPLLLVLAVPMWVSLALITDLTPFCLMMLLANLAFVAPEKFRAVLRLGAEAGAKEHPRPHPQTIASSK